MNDRDAERKRLLLLADALFEDLMKTTDEELIKEAAEHSKPIQHAGRCTV